MKETESRKFTSNVPNENEFITEEAENFEESDILGNDTLSKLQEVPSEPTTVMPSPTIISTEEYIDSQ